MEGVEVARSLVLVVDAIAKLPATLAYVSGISGASSLDVDDLYVSTAHKSTRETHLSTVVHDKLALCYVLAGEHTKPSWASLCVRICHSLLRLTQAIRYAFCGRRVRLLLVHLSPVGQSLPQMKFMCLFMQLSPQSELGSHLQTARSATRLDRSTNWPAC